MLGAALTGLAGAAPAADVPPVPFAVGEKLHYRIFWGPLPVGEALLHVRGIEMVDGHECYHFVAEAHTTGLGRALFPMDTVTESWTDRKELFSRRFHQDRHEGRHSRQRQTSYDYVQKQAVTKNLKNGREERVALDGPVQDMVSSLYYARTRPLALNAEQQFVLNTSDANYQIRLRPDQRRQLTVRPVGDVPALRVEPKPTLKIVSANSGRMWLWISDDARRLPLVLNSTMSIGSAKMVLYKVDLPPTPQYSALPVVPAAN